MAKATGSRRKVRPALTLEARQNQLISMAIDQAAKQLEEGTASSQVLTHFLKLGTVQAQVELEKLKRENELLTAKTEALQSQKHIEELYANAISAMQIYAGNRQADPEEDDYDY